MKPVAVTADAPSRPTIYYFEQDASPLGLSKLTVALCRTFAEHGPDVIVYLSRSGTIFGSPPGRK